MTALDLLACPACRGSRMTETFASLVPAEIDESGITMRAIR